MRIAGRRAATKWLAGGPRVDRLEAPRRGRRRLTRRWRAADVLVVMARQPVPGAVKTRLARHVGADAACALYRAFLTDIAAGLGAGPWRLTWAVTPADVDLRPIVGAGSDCFPQRGADLGERMASCFDDLFGGGAARVVMIGADVPHLGASAVAAAFAALDTADVVLTPTRDGGYCLVGQRRPHDLFRGIEMGTDRVFAQTMERIAGLGLRWRHSTRDVRHRRMGGCRRAPTLARFAQRRRAPRPDRVLALRRFAGARRSAAP